MTALAADRNTPERAGEDFVFPVAASAKIYAGGIVVLGATGYAAKGTTATGLIAVGRAEEQVDNTGGADGAKSIKVRRGVFRYANSAAGDAIARANIGADCYIVDDQTVAKTDGTGTRSAAGKIVDVDADGVWVSVGHPQASAVIGSTHKVIAAGIHAWAGGAAPTDSIAVAGLLATDVVLATLVARAATETLVMAANDAGNDQIDLTLSANGTDATTQVAYTVLRAL